MQLYEEKGEENWPNERKLLIRKGKVLSVWSNTAEVYSEQIIKINFMRKHYYNMLPGNFHIHQPSDVYGVVD